MRASSAPAHFPGADKPGAGKRAAAAAPEAPEPNHGKVEVGVSTIGERRKVFDADICHVGPDPRGASGTGW
jgi:hypothetical protein